MTAHPKRLSAIGTSEGLSQRPKGFPAVSEGAKFAPEVVLEGSPNSLDNAIEEYPEAISEGARRESMIKVMRG